MTREKRNKRISSNCDRIFISKMELADDHDYDHDDSDVDDDDM
jgi:hypothetical protein